MKMILIHHKILSNLFFFPLDYFCMFSSFLLNKSHRFITNLTKHISTMTSIQLKTILSQFKDYAPLYLADQSWDNVGLLVEPSDDNPTIETIFLTNDLTEPVLDEAIERQAQLIISYHPPIFSPLKRLTQSNWKERIILKCIRHGIAVYSPHTSWDAVENGINQWLISAFGKGRVLRDICH
jgi:putative NIF3 family GTP cyclohydrolase 1 type 2